MSIIDELIYDRTVVDVYRWLELRDKGYANTTDEEKAEWGAGMKGAYNPLYDFNRVETAVRYLAGVLSGYGYHTPMQTKTDWGMLDIPTNEELTRYLTNISVLRSAISIPPNMPDTPESMERLTWVEANNIEKILVDLEALITLVAKSFSRSNAFTFWSGNRPLPCAESDLGRTWGDLEVVEAAWGALDGMDQYLVRYGNLS